VSEPSPPQPVHRAAATESRLRHQLHEAKESVVVLRAQVEALRSVMEDLERQLAKEALSRESAALQLEHEQDQLTEALQRARERQWEHNAALKTAEQARAAAEAETAQLRILLEEQAPEALASRLESGA
jgi:predicted  nucleic acid-binding Zn-ribbon protein